jgi:CHAT domain-containing protein
LGQYPKAIDYYQQALVITREIGDKKGISMNLTNLGVVYDDLGQYPKAIDYYQQALVIQREIGVISWLTYRGLASAEAHLQLYDDAIKHYEQALDNIEELRSSLTKEHKLSFMQRKLYVYDELIALLQSLHQKQPEKGYDRKAIETFERKQGRVFLEEMGQSGARRFVGLPKEISEGELSLEKQLAQTQQQLADEQAKPVAALAGEVVQNKALIKTLEQRQQQLQNELDALQEQIRTDYPDYYALKYPQPVHSDTLQKEVLQDEELMLVYAVMEDSTTLWVIGPKTFSMFKLPLGETALSKQVAQLRQLMGADEKTRGARLRRRKKREPQVDPLAKASNELYTRLIPKTVRPLLTAPYTVYVVPTGPLYALPFETLVTHKPSASKKIHYLIEQVPIAYLSSASLLKILREAQQRRQNTAPYPFLAFANPVYEAEQTSDISKTSEILALRSQSYRTIRGGEFAPLPETEDEAKEIAALFNAPKDSEPLQLREAASRPTVLQLNEQKRLDDYQYILFAMHGILPGEVDQVTQSALVLSHPDTKGYLTMADVFGLQLNAKLVSLSACNTGGGKHQRGEGVMGLTRAFMYAGTPAIAVTYWSVESYSAKTLSVGFFKQFKDIKKPAAALRAIKLRMLHGKEGRKYKRPYYWAPFVIYGNAQ